MGKVSVPIISDIESETSTKIIVICLISNPAIPNRCIITTNIYYWPCTSVICK